MIISRSVKETLAAAEALAATLRAGDVLALSGDLGAGKTHFVKGIAAGLQADAEVTSPTFTLIHEYRGGRLPLFHFDLYRLETPEEAQRIGLDEYLDGDGVCVLEWAEKFPELLPPGTRWLRFRLRGMARARSRSFKMKIIAIETSTPRGSLAIWSDGGLMWERSFLAERGASSELFTLLEQARDRCDGATQIAVGLGPGSFSGVRIAIAAAVGFGLALDAPLVGCSSYSALAAKELRYCVLGDARRGTFYYAEVRDGECVAGPELVLDAAALKERLSSAALPIYTTEALADFPQAACTFPCASVLAERAAAGRGILQRGALQPLYLRPPHITAPRPRQGPLPR